MVLVVVLPDPPGTAAEVGPAGAAAPDAVGGQLGGCARCQAGGAGSRCGPTRAARPRAARGAAGDSPRPPTASGFPGDVTAPGSRGPPPCTPGR
jgi:hypothetical protein